MKLAKLKGSRGFCITWIVLALFDLIMIFYDFKLAIMGIIILTLFGFLGFDMLGSLCKKFTEEVKRK